MDRRSNEKVLVNYQSKIYDEFGYFLNRKKGEFFEGLNRKYISRDLIIELATFMRVALSVSGDAVKARRNSDEVLFREKTFSSVFFDTDVYRKYIFGYMCYQVLIKYEKQYEKTSGNRNEINTFGYALRYGKYAVVSIASRLYNNEIKPEDYMEKVSEAVELTLSKWKTFEEIISKDKNNRDYFYTYEEKGETKVFYNFDGYYKGRTLNSDLAKWDLLIKTL